MTHMNPDQWRGSKLVGVNIYGQNNEKIGDVNEVLIDRKGNADAIVVGVGGFLGMGEKDVALPFSAVEWKYDRNDLSTASTNRPATTGTTAANPPASGSMAANPPATGTTGAPATTGTTAANRPATADRSNMDRGYPDHGVVKFSKDELKNAPTFRYSMNDDTSRANAPARTTAPANTNPPASHDGAGDGAEAVSRTRSKSDEGPRRKAGPFLFSSQADQEARNNSRDHQLRASVFPSQLRRRSRAAEEGAQGHFSSSERLGPLRALTQPPRAEAESAVAEAAGRELAPFRATRQSQCAVPPQLPPEYCRTPSKSAGPAHLQPRRRPRRTRRPRMRSGSRRLIYLQAELHDHIPKLAHLIWLRVLADRLHVQRPLDVGMHIDVMATRHTIQLEPKAPQEVLQISERNDAYGSKDQVICPPSAAHNITPTRSSPAACW